MGKRHTNEINWRRVFHFAVPCVLILILFVVGPVNYAKLEHIQLDAGVLESAYWTPGGRYSSAELMLIVNGEQYRITKTCVEDNLKNLEVILQRRIGEHVYLRYKEDFFKRRTIVELDYMGLKLVDYDYAMAHLEPALKESAYVSVGAGLLYILLLVVLKYMPDIMKH